MRSTSPARAAAQREPPALLRGWGVLLGAWLGAVAGPSCTLVLDSGFSCGDGYTNREDGEDCDPADPDSYVRGCEGTNRPYGIADCDPTHCTIINDIEQCTACGDGIADEGEECDKDDLNGRACPSGKGALQCDECRLDYSACDRCGDGVRDPDEECDPKADAGITVGRPPCTLLESPYASRPYAGGTPGPCTDECKWDRITCHYCGNGKIETDVLVDSSGNEAPPELCDGEALNQTLLNTTLSDDPCTSMDGDLRSHVVCRSDCTVERLGTCCVNAGKPCPDDGAGMCCYALETLGFEPGDEACGDNFNGKFLFEACLSDDDEGLPTGG